MRHRRATHCGFSLIEVLIYTAVLVVTTTIIVSALVTLSRSYSELRLMQAMQRSAITALERIAHEVRLADSVDGAASTLGTHPGVLVLDNVTESGVETTEFSLDGDVLRVIENTIPAGALTADELTVSQLVFYAIDNGTTEGVRTEITLRGTVGTTTLERTFQSFIVTRE